MAAVVRSGLSARIGHQDKADDKADGEGEHCEAEQVRLSHIGILMPLSTVGLPEFPKTGDTPAMQDDHLS